MQKEKLPKIHPRNRLPNPTASSLWEKVLSNKTQELTKSVNMDICVVGTLNQLFLKSSYAEIKFTKNKVVIGKTSYFLIVPFCTRNANVNIILWQRSLIWKSCDFSNFKSCVF